MKINEYDENYYDYLQGRLNKQREPWKYDGNTHYTNKPNQDTQIEDQDWIISKYIAGDITYEQAQKMIANYSSSEEELKYWLIELIHARNENG